MQELTSPIPAAKPAGTSLIKTIARSFVPPAARDWVKAKHREMVFRRAMRRFLAAPDLAIDADSKLLGELIYGWGNESWSALEEYLTGCISHALRTEGDILECGSGLSTLMIGAIAKYRGIRHVALEHHAGWAARVQAHLDRYKIDSVTLVARPLRNQGEFTWYDTAEADMPKRFGMIICDGPPGDTKGGRYGLVPVMRERFGTGTVIFLDDAGREQEREIAARWAEELDSTSEEAGILKPYIRITVK